MATYNAPIDPPYVPSTSSGGLSATTITQIVIGVGLVFVPVVICCVCGSTWIASKLRRRPREEYVDEEIVFDSMGQAIFVSRRQRTWLDVPTYKEVELVEVDSEGRWIEIQVSLGPDSTRKDYGTYNVPNITASCCCLSGQRQRTTQTPTSTVSISRTACSEHSPTVSCSLSFRPTSLHSRSP